MNNPIILNPDGSYNRVLSTIDTDSAKIKKVINGEYTFNFKSIPDEFNKLNINNKLILKDQTFNIVRISTRHNSDGLTYSVQCEHVNYDLINVEYDKFTMLGTPREILNNIFNNTDFKVGTIYDNKIITISINEKTNAKQILKYVAALINAEINYSDLGYTINLIDTIGVDRGFVVNVGKNLIGIDKDVDNRGGLKTSYKINLTLLKNTTEYIDSGLSELESVDIGDTIHVIDDLMDESFQNRILSIEYNPLLETNISVELVNKIVLITDEINNIKTNVVYKGELYNNVSISSDYGFRATRSDKRARTTFSGDEISMETGDGTGSWNKAMYFDPVLGKYKFVGDIEATASIIGGNINIGNGTFVVDESGNATLNSLTIGGGSGIRNLNDSGDLATKNSVDMLTGEVLNKGDLATKNSVDLLTNEVLNKGDLATLNSISGTYIDDNAVTASKIYVNELSSISANIGHITAGDISGVVYSTRGGNDNRLVIGEEYDGRFQNIKWVNTNGEETCHVFGSAEDEYLELSSSDKLELSSKKIGIVAGTVSIHSLQYNGLLGGKWYYNDSYFHGESEIATKGDCLSPGNGLVKNGTYMDINPSAIAGYGLKESGNDLSVDADQVVTNNSGQQIKLQVYNGHLEYSLNGSSFTKLAND